MLAPATAEVARVDATAKAGCAELPMGGVGSTLLTGGTATIAGTERRRIVRVGARATALGRDVASATIRAACKAPGVDYMLLAVAANDAACPVQYQVVEARGAAPLRLSRRFGSCVDGATARLADGGVVVTMPAGPARPETIAYRYAAGRLEAVAAVQPPRPPVVVQVVKQDRRGFRVTAWTAPPACAAIARAEPGVPADVYLADLRRTWPRDWQTRGRLGDQPFETAALRSLVTDLSCLSALPGGESVVIETARPLFASRRHGRAAFEQLDEVARGSTVDPAIRAAARQLHAQMRFRIDDPRLR
ncbi:hypothetical protein [Glacieibacterium frigidum]|uniref:Uncharacterized protein n=1 Tax=Glacieibacterium frigidum TaxID=2593303 RepID=A0A552UGR6_9SPHN|nr:hypothetical protein [Glacieibacterium frigidum]TRW17377.1 hypothetical protein FMM06_04170 [Glacieibacterium frigidum]